MYAYMCHMDIQCSYITLFQCVTAIIDISLQFSYYSIVTDWPTTILRCDGKNYKSATKQDLNIDSLPY